jgi:sugar transferase (PEP-CTERM/EpsH1 system associated)
MAMKHEILFICHRIPFPPNRGDKIRSHHILKRLARIAPVHVACFADDDADMAEEVELAAMSSSYRLVRRGKPLALAGVQAFVRGCSVSRTAFEDPSLASYVRGVLATGQIRTIYLFSGQMGQYVPADFTGRLIVDFVDVDSAKFEAYSAKKGGVRGRIDAREGRWLRAEEASLAQRADVSLLVSDAEAKLFTARLPEALRQSSDVRAVYNGIDSAFFDPGLVNPEQQLRALPGPCLIFTGQMDYRPNFDAALRVARRILPEIRRRLPDASFHIVGRNPVAELIALDGRDGVHVWGRVDDIRGWVKGADIALVPLEIARGVQNKVLEAMAMQLPVVLTSAAATGISAAADTHFVVADSDADLAAAVVNLAADPNRAKSMGLAARRFVAEQQSWQSTLAPLPAIITGPPRAHRDAA